MAFGKSVGQSFATTFNPAFRESYKFTSADIAEDKKEKKRRNLLRKVGDDKSTAILDLASEQALSSTSESLGLGTKLRNKGGVTTEDLPSPRERIDTFIKSAGNKRKQAARAAAVAQKISAWEAKTERIEERDEQRKYDANEWTRRYREQQGDRLDEAALRRLQKLEDDEAANQQWLERNDLTESQLWERINWQRVTGIEDAEKALLKQSQSRAAYNYFRSNPEAKVKSFKGGKALSFDGLRAIKNEAKHAPTAMDKAKEQAEATRTVGRKSPAHKESNRLHDKLMINMHSPEKLKRIGFKRYNERDPEESDANAERGKEWYSLALRVQELGGKVSPTLDESEAILRSALIELGEPSPEEAGEMSGIEGAARAQTMNLKRYTSEYGDVPFVNEKDKDDAYFTLFKPGSNPSKAVRKKAFDDLKQKQGFVWDEKAKAWILPVDLED
jgi:hypothetical protein